MTDYADLEKCLRQEARDMENHYTTRELSTEAADALASLTRELEDRNRRIVMASQACHDFANRFRDFEEVARRIATNTGKSIEEARSIARSQNAEAMRLGATTEAALATLVRVLSSAVPGDGT